MDRIETFRCDFDDGASISFAFNFSACLRAAETGEAFSTKIQWVGRLTLEKLPSYAAWMHKVNTDISQVIDRPHTHALSFAPWLPYWEIWEYHPDGTKRCLQKGVSAPPGARRLL